MDFKDLKEAITAFEAEVKAHNASKAELVKKTKEAEKAQTAFEAEVAAHKATKAELAEATKVAEEAIAQINETPARVTNDVLVTVDKTKYKVVFGVDGLTKEEVAKDKALLARLVKIGSAALEIVGE